jgi:hypothetical protein
MNQASQEFLTIKIHHRLDVLSDEERSLLFPDYPDSLALIQLLQKSGMEGFILHSLLVRDKKKPVLMLPLFETHYVVHSVYQGWGKALLNYLTTILPRFFKPKVLGIGFVEGEWGQVGYDPTVSQKRLSEAWDIALEALHSMQKALQADLLAFVDFNETSGAILPMDKLQNFATMSSNPCGVIPITFDSQDDYLNRLSKSLRKNLKRKIKEAQQISIVHTKSPTDIQLKTIYDLYCQTVARSELVFGVQQESFFQQVCCSVSGAGYS